MLAPELAAARGRALARPPATRLSRCADEGELERWCALPAADARDAGWARARAAAAVAADCQASGLPAALGATPADLLADPQLCARGWWQRVDGVVRDGVVPHLEP